MRRTVCTLVVLVLLAAAVGAVAEEAPVFKRIATRSSYSLGVEMGNNLKRQSIDVDPALLAQGIKDALAGGKMLLGEAEVREVVMAFQKDLMAKQQATQKVKADKAKAEGETFLAANAKKEGVVTLPSGLQYKVDHRGHGAITEGDRHGQRPLPRPLVDGTEFDSSYARNEPATFPVQRRDPGLDRGAAAHEGRLEVGALHPGQPRLR